MTNLSGRGPLGLKPAKPERGTTAAKAHPLRKNAKGQDCTLRLLGCRSSSEYTVLAHLRRFGWAGMSQKPHDLLAIFACDKCHHKQESRHVDCTDTDLLRALGETIMIQLHNGIIRVGNEGMD